jgi:hypothetical protein
LQAPQYKCTGPVHLFWHAQAAPWQPKCSYKAPENKCTGSVHLFGHAQAASQQQNVATRHQNISARALCTYFGTLKPAPSSRFSVFREIDIRNSVFRAYRKAEFRVLRILKTGIPLFTNIQNRNSVFRKYRKPEFRFSLISKTGIPFFAHIGNLEPFGQPWGFHGVPSGDLGMPRGSPDLQNSERSRHA